MLLLKHKEKKKTQPKNYIERQNSSPYQILNDDIIPPKMDSIGTIIFIYINDYTYNSGVWKHVLHKGNELNIGYPSNYSNGII